MTNQLRPKPLPLAVVIAGPTGAGKSAIALELAERIGGEIVNYDSVQIYRGFDIGSAKPTRAEQTRIPHHLIDVIDADEHFSAAVFAARALDTIAVIQARNRTPILVGGTGFYLRALLVGLPEMPGRDEAIRARIRSIWGRPGGPDRLFRRLARIDPVSASKIAPSDRHRIERALEVYLLSGRPISSWSRPDPRGPARLLAIRFAVDLPRMILNETLDLRVALMYEKGLVDETRALLERFDLNCRPFEAIGYREAVGVVQGRLDQGAAIEETRRRTRAYAKRQATWLRSETGFAHLDRSQWPGRNIIDALIDRIEVEKGQEESR